jgi:hypothetical protein
VRAALDGSLRVLECRYQAKGVLPRLTNCVAREQSSEIDQFKCVTQVCDVGLEAYRAFFMLVEVDAHRSILREVRIDAVAIKIEVINPARYRN